jgi:hypothetical protein
MTYSPSWLADCRNELNVSHETEVFLKFALLAQGHLGYEHAAIGFEVPNSAAQPRYSYFNNYTPDWLERFISPGQRHGSHVAAGKRTAIPSEYQDPMYWSRADFKREAQAHGIALTWSAAIPCKLGAVGFVALSTPRIALPSPGPDCLDLARLAIAAMESIILSKALPNLDLDIALTPTARKVLRLVLDGHTAADIADLLGISQNKVAYLYRKLPEMFGRDQIFPTAFLAHQLGLLSHE